MWCPCSNNLSDAEPQVLVKEISRPHSIQTELLLAAFSQIHREIWKHKAEQKDVKITQFGEENGMFKTLLVKEINSIKQQPANKKGPGGTLRIGETSAITDTSSWVRGAP